MRKQIAIANWKMNLSLMEAESLVDELLKAETSLQDNQQTILAVPFPYIITIKNKIKNKTGIQATTSCCYCSTSRPQIMAPGC